MLGALRHRGPDASGIYLDARAGLAHTRLSIIDLATGDQPMGDGEGLWIAFNGEIYNYLELRAELEAAGHRFRTRSDTEVILQAWRCWGERALTRFNGQWALALWDAREGSLVLSRDRLGIRPLHYLDNGQRVVFASEVKAIFAAAPEHTREFDAAGLAETLTFWTVVAPRSVFRGIAELPPGHVRTYRNGGVRERAYWRQEHAADFDGSLEEATERVRAALVDATALRMLRADVPVGCYLSGGLDSSVVAALALQATGGERFHTFSLRFEDAEYDEAPFQRQMAARLGSNHHEVHVSRRDIAESFPAVVRHAERPLLRTAPAPLYLLSRLVRDSGIKVVLTGEGADEMFAGYDLFREGVIRRFWARQPDSRSRPRLLDKLYPYLARSPVKQQALPPDFGRWSYLAQDQYLEVHTLLSGYLLASQGDRMLMGHSVEGRFPYLDHELVELANSLPDRFKLRVLDEKHLLKRLAADLVPRDIVERVKQPYRAPDAHSFVGEGAPAWIEEMVSESAITDAGVFQPAAVRSLWSKCQARAGSGQFSNTDNMALVAVLSTQLLHRELIRAPAAEAPGHIDTLIDKAAD